MRRAMIWATLFLMLAGCAGPAEWAGRREFRELPHLGPLKSTCAARLLVLNQDKALPANGLLVVELRLLNITPTEAVVHTDFEQGSVVVLEILGENGQYVRSVDVPRKKRPDERAHLYARLAPNGVAGQRYVIAPRGSAWLLDPGRYRMRAVYRSPYRTCVVAPGMAASDVKKLGKKALVDVLSGLLTSNVVEFEVMPPTSDKDQ
jgi:hypothetical protein